MAGAVVLAPIVGEVVRKINSSWRPTGDDAIFAINAHDVFSKHPPLLGTYSVVTQSAGKLAPAVYHLGPMVSWVLAIPERFFSERLGVAIGAAIVNALMLVATVAVVRVMSNDRVALLAGGALALTIWSVGHTTLAEPWNPYIGLWALPLLCAISTAFATGRSWLLGWMIVVASFAVQAHYLYLGPVGFVAGVALAVWFVSLWRGAIARPPRRVYGWAVLAVVVCWMPSIVQQAFGHPGNLSSWWTVTNATGDARAPFINYSLRFAVNVIGFPTAATRGSLGTRELLALSNAPSFVAWGSCAALVGCVVAGAVLFRRTQHVVSVFATVALAVTIGAVFTLSRYPRAFVSFPYYRIVMLWCVAMVLWSAALNVVWHASLHFFPSVIAWLGRGVQAGAMMLVGFAALLAVVGVSPDGPVNALGARATQRLANGARTSLVRGHSYVVVGEGANAIFVVYGVFRELHNAGFTVYVPNSEVQLRRVYGLRDRRASQLIVSSGTDPLPRGARVLARYDGRSERDRSRYDTLAAAAKKYGGTAEADFQRQRFGYEQQQFAVFLLPD